MDAAREALPDRDPDGEPSGTESRVLIGGDRNDTKARVFRYRDGDRDLVVKTAAGGGFVARWLLRRESSLFRAMPPLRCLPVVVEATPDRIVTEFVAAKDLFDLRWTGLSDRRAAALEDALGELHRAGFAHGDLGRHDILFVGDRVVFVDFATGIGPGTPPGIWRLLLPLWRWIDRTRVRRVTRRYTEMRKRRHAARIADGKADRRGRREGAPR